MNSSSWNVKKSKDNVGAVSRLNISIKELTQGRKTEGGQRVYFKRLGLKMLPVWDRFPALGQEASSR